MLFLPLGMEATLSLSEGILSDTEGRTEAEHTSGGPYPLPMQRASRQQVPPAAGRTTESQRERPGASPSDGRPSLLLDSLRSLRPEDPGVGIWYCNYYSLVLSEEALGQHSVWYVASTQAST